MNLLSDRALGLALTFGLVFATAGSALAHGPGPNGGQYVHIGQFHTEFFNEGTVLRFLVSDDAEKALASAGGQAEVTIAGSKPDKIAAEPAGGNAFRAMVAAPLPKGSKLVIRGRLASGQSFLGRFEIP